MFLHMIQLEIYTKPVCGIAITKSEFSNNCNRQTQNLTKYMKMFMFSKNKESLQCHRLKVTMKMV